MVQSRSWGLVRVQVGVGVYLLYKTRRCLGHPQQDCVPSTAPEPRPPPGTALGEGPSPPLQHLLQEILLLARLLGGSRARRTCCAARLDG